MTELDDQLREEKIAFKLDIVKTARSSFQAVVAFTVMFLSTYYTGPRDKASAITAGVLAAGIYFTANSQKPGGFKPTLNGFKKMRNFLGTLFILLVAITGTLAAPTRGEIRRNMDLYRRDHPICEACGKHTSTFHRLEIHHLHPQEAFPDEASNATNFIALCRPCHFSLAHAGNFKKYVSNLREVLALRAVKENKR